MEELGASSAALDFLVYFLIEKEVIQEALSQALNELKTEFETGAALLPQVYLLDKQR